MSGKTFISRKEILHYAKLCRISISEEEAKKLEKDINEILQYFDIIRSLQPDGEPMTYTTSANEFLRDDTPDETLNEEDVFKNAGDKEERWFVSGHVWG